MGHGDTPAGGDGQANDGAAISGRDGWHQHRLRWRGQHPSEQQIPWQQGDDAIVVAIVAAGVKVSKRGTARGGVVHCGCIMAAVGEEGLQQQQRRR